MNWTQTWRGAKVIEDRFAYEETITFKHYVVGIPDKRRPNSKKMLYRKVTKRIVNRKPLAILVKGKHEDTILIHPDLMRSLEKHLRDRVASYTQSAFLGFDPAIGKDETVLTYAEVDKWNQNTFLPPSTNP